MSGSNTDLLRNVCAATDRPVIASGASSLQDLRVLAELVGIGVEGAIRWQGTLRRRFTVREVLAVVR